MSLAHRPGTEPAPPPAMAELGADPARTSALAGAHGVPRGALTKLAGTAAPTSPAAGVPAGEGAGPLPREPGLL